MSVDIWFTTGVEAAVFRFLLKYWNTKDELNESQDVWQGCIFKHLHRLISAVVFSAFLIFHDSYLCTDRDTDTRSKTSQAESPPHQQAKDGIIVSAQMCHTQNQHERAHVAFILLKSSTQCPLATAGGGVSQTQIDCSTKPEWKKFALVCTICNIFYRHILFSAECGRSFTPGIVHYMVVTVISVWGIIKMPVVLYFRH